MSPRLKGAEVGILTAGDLPLISQGQGGSSQQEWKQLFVYFVAIINSPELALISHPGRSRRKNGSGRSNSGDADSGECQGASLTPC